MEQLSDDTLTHVLIFVDDVDYFTVQTVCQCFYKVAHSTMINNHWKLLALSMMEKWNSKEESKNHKNLDRVFPMDKIGDYQSMNWHRIYHELLDFTIQNDEFQSTHPTYFRDEPLVFDACQMNLLMLLKLLFSVVCYENKNNNNNNNNNTNIDMKDSYSNDDHGDENQRRININMTCRIGWDDSVTLLSHAIAYQSVEIIEYLLTFDNIDLNIETRHFSCLGNYKHTPLMYASWLSPARFAIQKGKNMKIVEMLLNHCKVNEEYINKIDTFYGDTALNYACQNGNSTAVRLLVKHGADVNKAGATTKFPLLTTLQTWKQEHVSRLDCGDDKMVIGKEVDKYYQECATILLNTGVIFKPGQDIMCFEYCVNDFMKPVAMSIVKEIIKIDHDNNKKNNIEYDRVMSRVLMHAAQHDFVKILLFIYNYWMENKDCLMKNNIDTSAIVNKQFYSHDNNGVTPFIKACKKGNIGSINILKIKFAADVTIVDGDGKCGEDYLNVPTSQLSL